MATDRRGVTPDGLLDGRRPTDAMDFQATEDSASDPPMPMPFDCLARTFTSLCKATGLPLISAIGRPHHVHAVQELASCKCGGTEVQHPGRYATMVPPFPRCLHRRHSRHCDETAAASGLASALTNCAEWDGRPC